MAFELIEPGKQFSNSELIDDLKRVSSMLQKNNVSLNEYKEHGNYSYQTQKKRFGSWKGALEAAELSKSKRPWGADLSETKIPEKQLIEDMQQVAEKLNKNQITMAEYEKYGNFGSTTIQKRFGGWNKAKEKAGLTIGRYYNQSEEEYFDNLLHIWQILGRQPKYREIEAPLSKIHISSYERKFGSWRNALESFIKYINTKDDFVSDIKKTKADAPGASIIQKPMNSKKKKVKTKRTNRTANLRQRFRVMKRDGFKCILCGASPANNPGIELHIDHVIPWSHGGETVEENLRTLCSSCNLGRSNAE